MSLMYQTGRGACIVYALLSVGLCWTAQALTVHYNYQGNWTALFQTGPRRPTPPALEFENIYKFEKTRGYDGQFYHYVAHDPLLTKRFSKHVDDPRLRWRRILVPGLAFLAAGGQQRLVDTAYLSVTLCFVFLGTYWLARYCCLHRTHPAWGLGFLVCSSGSDFGRKTDDRHRSSRLVHRLRGLRGPPVVETGRHSRACASSPGNRNRSGSGGWPRWLGETKLGPYRRGCPSVRYRGLFGCWGSSTPELDLTPFFGCRCTPLKESSTGHYAFLVHLFLTTLPHGQRYSITWRYWACGWLWPRW